MPASPASTQLQFFTGSVCAGIALLYALLPRLGISAAWPALVCVAAWWAFVSFSQPLWKKLHTRAAGATASRRTRILAGMAALAGILIAAAFAWTAWRLLPGGQPPPPPSPEAASRAVILGVTLFALLYFFRHAVAGRSLPRQEDPRAGVGLLLAMLLAGVAALLVRRHAPAWDFFPQLNRIAGWLALLLPLEWLLARALRGLQTPSQRRAYPFCGYSFSAGLVFGGHSPLQALARSVHDSFGLEIRGTWLSRYARYCVEPLLLVLVLAGWLSTAVVIVPVDSEGIRVTWGKFQNDTLKPGLHLIAPWPVERVRLVPAGRVQDFALGFEKDLGGPVLWTEVHFSGESNLLVGNGEEVLTFNVPVQFDLADALAAERTSADLPRLLSSLAQRELLLATASRTSFGLMTGERDMVSAQIQTGLQAAADQLGLGARVRYVGLKDIHPPVAVAPAFQEVISAQEQRRMMIDLASANRITALAEANSESFRVRRQAGSFAAERLAAVSGEAALLSGKVEARQTDPALFDFRNRLGVLEDVVPRIRLILTSQPAAGDRAAVLYDLREGGASLP